MSGERTVWLVRHGRATAGWDTDPDPDLDELGRVQAATAARQVVELCAGSGRPSPSAIVSSPLLRCRSTAAFLAELTELPVSIAPQVAEIPSPAGVAMHDRVEWLRSSMRGTWTELGDRYTSYRDAVVEFVAGCADGAVVFSHFVAINTVIGACLGDDRLVIRSLDNCSITTVTADDDGRLTMIAGGHEADTLIR